MRPVFRLLAYGTASDILLGWPTVGLLSKPIRRSGTTTNLKIIFRPSPILSCGLVVAAVIDRHSNNNLTWSGDVWN